MPDRKNPLTPFGRAVKKRLIDINMSNAELSKAIGCPNNKYLTDILNGRRSGGKYVPEICKVLEIPEPTDGRTA